LASLARPQLAWAVALGTVFRSRKLARNQFARRCRENPQSARANTRIGSEGASHHPPV
jgi:hypothetical protein